MSDLSGRQPQAVQGAFAVLEEVARAGPGVTAQQVSAALGMPRATTYRLLNLLVQHEYLVRLPELSGFALGRKVALLAGMTERHDATREAGAVLADMRARIRAGVHLASYREDTVVLVDMDPDFPLPDPDLVATDLGATAFGRLLLAERARPGAVDYAVEVGERTPGFACLAAPVRDRAGRLVAGLALTVPAARITEPGALIALIAADVGRLETIADRL